MKLALKKVVTVLQLDKIFSRNTRVDSLYSLVLANIKIKNKIRSKNNLSNHQIINIDLKYPDQSLKKLMK